MFFLLKHFCYQSWHTVSIELGLLFSCICCPILFIILMFCMYTPVLVLYIASVSWRSLSRFWNHHPFARYCHSKSGGKSKWTQLFLEVSREPYKPAREITPRLNNRSYWTKATKYAVINSFGGLLLKWWNEDS